VKGREDIEKRGVMYITGKNRLAQFDGFHILKFDGRVVTTYM